MLWYRTHRRAVLCGRCLTPLPPPFVCACQDKHQPKLNGGIVVKTNANQRYATSAVSSFILKEAARRSGVAVQVRGARWISPRQR